MVTIENDQDTITDALYYERADFIMTIEKGYSSAIAEGNCDGLFTSYHMHPSYAEALVQQFLQEYVKTVSAGIAGGMDNAIKVCDIVVSTEVLPHDLDLHFLKDYPPYCGIFKADEKLISAAEKACSDNGAKSFRGRIVSGDAFITSSVIKAEIQGKFSPSAVDMESAAVGQCCFLSEKPFVSVRCISDNADDEGAMSFDEFEKIAAKRVAEIVLEMITNL